MTLQYYLALAAIVQLKQQAVQLFDTHVIAMPIISVYSVLEDLSC